MHRLNRSETFQKRFNLPTEPKLPARRALPDQLRGEGRKPLRRLLNVLWWFSLLAATAIPAWAVYVTDLPSAWSQIDLAVKETLEFPSTHRIHVPKKSSEPQVGLGTIDGGFAKTNADMVTWHRGMAVLQRRIADETPVGSVQDSTLEFVFHGPALSKAPSREWRAAAVSLYFALAASLYFVDSVHIAIILFQLNLLEFSLAIMIKRLDDALEKTLEHLSASHMELAMLPLETDPLSLGQHQLCLQKMEIFYDVWNAVNLGQNIRIPFRKDFVNLNLNLVFSVVAAVLLRSLEVLLQFVWPSLPRFNLSKRLLGYLQAGISGRQAESATTSQELPQLAAFNSAGQMDGGVARTKSDSQAAKGSEELWDKSQ